MEFLFFTISMSLFVSFQLVLSEYNVVLASSMLKLVIGISILAALFRFNGTIPCSSFPHPPLNGCATCLRKNGDVGGRDKGGEAVPSLKKTGDIFLGDGVKIGELAVECNA